MTEVGLSVLFREQLAVVEGRSIGLITNQTGIDRQFRSNLTLFAEHPQVELTALFSPEHGISGSTQAGIQIASAIGKGKQIPIHSLYGETRQPTPGMLTGIDVLVYDIQDVGSRFYTYISTLLRSMRAAAANNVDFTKCGSVRLERENNLKQYKVFTIDVICNIPEFFCRNEYTSCYRMIFFVVRPERYHTGAFTF